MSSTRQKWIDNAKGIAMIAVIVGHASRGLEGLWDFYFVYGFHLVVFFLLSGYTLKKKRLDRDYINGKFLKLMVPYFFTCVAIMMTDVWNSYYWNHDSSIDTVTAIIGKDLVRSFFASGAHKTIGTVDTGTRIGAIWFLPALFFAIILFQAFLQWTSDSRKLGTMSALLALFGHISAKFIWLPFSIQAGMLALFFIWIGYEIRERNLLKQLRWYHFVIAQLIFYWGIQWRYCSIGYVTANINDLILSVVVGLSGCLLVYLISIHMKRSVVISWIGRNSLDILCIHLYSLEVMRKYIDLILDKMGLIEGNPRIWANIIIEIVFAVVIAYIIVVLRSKFARLHEKLLSLAEQVETHANKKRNVSIDIAKGIFIISMLVGNSVGSGTLRTVIYSCHMVVFVFVSGYFYKRDNNIMKTFLRMVKTFLVPYALFVGGVILLHHSRWSAEYFVGTLRQYMIGMVLSRKLVADSASIGGVYLILLLFVIRILYALIDRIVKNESWKLCIILVLSVTGMMLGKKEYWLPWSVDVALYSLVFFQLGRYFKDYNLLSIIKKNYISYFILTPIWAYMIYNGGMELAVRNYGGYGLGIIGSLAGILVVMMMADYIYRSLPLFSMALSYIGEKSLILFVIIYTMFGGYINRFVELRFNKLGVLFMISCIVLQILIVVILKLGISFVTKKGIKCYLFKQNE